MRCCSSSFVGVPRSLEPSSKPRLPHQTHTQPRELPPACRVSFAHATSVAVEHAGCQALNFECPAFLVFTRSAQSCHGSDADANGNDTEWRHRSRPLGQRTNQPSASDRPLSSSCWQTRQASGTSTPVNAIAGAPPWLRGAAMESLSWLPLPPPSHPVGCTRPYPIA